MDILVSINAGKITMSVDGGQATPVDGIEQVTQVLTEAVNSAGLAPPQGEMPVEGQEPIAEATADPNEQAELAGQEEEAAMSGAYRPMR